MLRLASIKCLFLMLVLLCSTSVTALTLGNSAWLYGKNDVWIKQIKKFNEKNKAQYRLNYLFPEVGSLHIDNEHKKIILTYDPSVTKFYKMRLPSIKIMPDISFWVANTNFKFWSRKQYRAAAREIVDKINQDDNADGVFLDLESYKPSLLPFYVGLVHGLSLHHKLLSVIVRPGQENVPWFKVLGKNAFVVLYGYDLRQPGDHVLPVSPEVYQLRLSVAVENLMKVSDETHTLVMGGLPVVATTYEWEEKSVSDGQKNRRHFRGKYRQIEYMRSALRVYTNTNLKNYMGFSIWAFVLRAKNNQMYFPNQITEESWLYLKNGGS